MTDEKLHGLTNYQRDTLQKTINNGWTMVSVCRHANDLNPWSTVNMISPHGDEMKLALPVSKQEAEHMNA